jgi:aspartyl-tRNA(Asn)/glutamyl-tRNA(Gln) amidotransferase subunit A
MSAGIVDPADRSIRELADALRDGRLLATDVVGSVLRRLDATEPSVHAFAYVAAAAAMAEAEVRDRLASRGEFAGPLHGIPVGVKDLFETADMPTAAGSKVLTGNRPAHDAEAVRRLRAAGAVVVGKTVTHEFSYGLDEPPTRNAWDLTRYPGGSSAGSAVAVAVGSAAGSIGTDTAGSVRTPAAVNGVVGLKPTYGTVSTRGVIPSCPSLDHVGPLARRVSDCALLYSVLSEGRPFNPQMFDAAADRPLTDVRLGVDRHYFFQPADPEIAGAIDRAIVVMEELGATIVEVDIPELEQASIISGPIMLVEAARWHERLLRDHGPDYHPATRRMLELGLLVPGVGYLKAQQAREVLRRAVRDAFEREGLNAVVAPSVPTVTSRVEEVDLDPLVHQQSPANLTGQPSVSVPCGFTGTGLPIGMQLIGRPFEDYAVLRMAHTYEVATEWHLKRPPVAAARGQRGAGV